MYPCGAVTAYAFQKQPGADSFSITIVTDDAIADVIEFYKGAPVIYSLDERAKLVFLIEARPEYPDKFRVGQPVTVSLANGAPK